MRNVLNHFEVLTLEIELLRRHDRKYDHQHLNRERHVDFAQQIWVYDDFHSENDYNGSHSENECRPVGFVEDAREEIDVGLSRSVFVSEL